MLARDWYYNDRRHVGLDFSAEAQVATYDRRQGDHPDRARASIEVARRKPRAGPLPISVAAPA